MTRHTSSAAQTWRYRLASVFLVLMVCLSFNARGDDHHTDEEDLSPGIRLRMESCGYVRSGTQGGDDDDSSGDED